MMVAPQRNNITSPYKLQAPRRALDVSPGDAENWIRQYGIWKQRVRKHYPWQHDASRRILISGWLRCIVYAVSAWQRKRRSAVLRSVWQTARTTSGRG